MGWLTTKHFPSLCHSGVVYAHSRSEGLQKE